MLYNLGKIYDIALSVGIVLVATVLHEMAHAACANALGDPTAKEQGRLTLNPLAHLDPVGSVVLPTLMAFVGGPIFAFAKPVPYNPRRLKHPIRDEVLVALAGPACNFCQAAVGSLVFRALIVAFTQSGAIGTGVLAVCQVLIQYVYLNLMLMFFNLLPLPPLDGSSIVSPLLRGKARYWYYRVQANALPVLLALLFLLPSLTHFNPIDLYLDATAGVLAIVMLGI